MTEYKSTTNKDTEEHLKNKNSKQLTTSGLFRVNKPLIFAFSLTCRRPYSAARSRGVSCWLFLMVGSVSSCSNTETTSECPYWAAQWSAVSLSWFCGKNDRKGGLTAGRLRGREVAGADGGIMGIVKSGRRQKKRGENRTEDGWKEAAKQQSWSKGRKGGSWWKRREKKKKRIEIGRWVL